MNRSTYPVPLLVSTTLRRVKWEYPESHCAGLVPLEGRRKMSNLRGAALTHDARIGEQGGHYDTEVRNR